MLTLKNARMTADGDPSATASHGGEFPPAALGDWHVLHTKSRQEKAVAETLQAQGIAHYLPLLRQPRFHGRHKSFVDLPLFSGYVFLRGSLNDAYRADRTRRIASIVPVPNQAQLDWELRNLHQALMRGAELDVYAFLVKGTRVEVRSGPFRGLQGVVDSRVRENRLVLQLNMLGRALSLEIDAGLLDVVHDG